MPLSRGSVTGRAVIDRTVIHLEDLSVAPEDEYPIGRELQRRFGHRAILSVPLMREDRAIGAIALWRMEPRAFTDKQIALVKTFADQAAIAIENVRLFNETKEALEQQTAFAAILRVIAASPADMQPVLDTVAERALKLCDAAQTTISLVEGENLHFVAKGSESFPTAMGDVHPLSRGLVVGRAILDRTTIHLKDIALVPEDDYPLARELQRRLGHHTLLAVPLMREDHAIGAISLWRMEARLFSEKQVALVQTFAQQAALAIDNVRLFNETKEGLEQQTAIAEILRVISASPTDVQPVLDAIAERAARHCDASAASMYLTEGNVLRHLASKGPSPDPVTHIDTLPINRESITGRALLDGQTIQVRDMHAEGGEFPASYEIARRIGHHSVVATPLYREGHAFGVIVLRRQEVRPFTEREIALLRTFGDQAAIALENVRLFNETKEALDQQRASGEVLAAISNSIADTTPVFDKILESCERLFAGRTVGINLVGEDGQIRLGAFHGPGREELEKVWPAPVNDQTGRAGPFSARGVVHVPDVEHGQGVSERTRQACKVIGVRGVIFAPMMWEGRGIGAIFVGRDYVGPFSEKDIALLKTFADQAVIAIQNARLVNETTEALEQQRASGEVLAAISNSIADTKPVFDKIVESCARLFAGKVITINLLGADGMVRPVAHHGPAREAFLSFGGFSVDDSAYASAICMRSRQVLHYPDQEDANVPAGTRESQRVAGTKATLFAPMVWEGRGIGAIAVGRDYAGPFSDKEIALLKTFADQAVIAIQNARLFNETTEALDQQRASGEVLAAISSSIADTTPVFDKILASCERLFAGTVVAIKVVGDDGMIRLASLPRAGSATNSTSISWRRWTRRIGSGNRDHRASEVRTSPDIEATRTSPARRRVGLCATSGSLRRHLRSDALGGQGHRRDRVGRDSVGPFSDKDIALLKTFADQAVIAIQNARLFNETTEALDQQRASGEVLAAISNSIADTTPVFEKILRELRAAVCRHGDRDRGRRRRWTNPRGEIPRSGPGR